jgi:hypothetical protein
MTVSCPDTPDGHESCPLCSAYSLNTYSLASLVPAAWRVMHPLGPPNAQGL